MTLKLIMEYTCRISSILYPMLTATKGILSATLSLLDRTGSDSLYLFRTLRPLQVSEVAVKRLRLFFNTYGPKNKQRK